MFDWDDLRLFITAARTGSFTRAAQQLGVDAATIARRVSRLEGGLKVTLFVRSVAGLRLTAAGERLAEVGLEVENAMLAAESAAEPDRVGGVVRLSTSEGFGAEILAPALPRLRAQRPALRVELVASSGFLSPGRREADITVTLTRPKDPRLSVELLTPYHLALYASGAYLAAHGAPQTVEDLKNHELVGYVEDLIYARELNYLDEVGKNLRPGLASSSIQAQRGIISHGGGIGVLPAFLAKGLEPVLAKDVRLTRHFFVTARSETADTARIRAVRTWLKDAAEHRRGDLLLP